jgi:hypothetical protein
MLSTRVEIPSSLLTSKQRAFESSSRTHHLKDLAWAAGLFVGEGSAGNHRATKEGKRHAVLQIGMYDRVAIEEFVAIIAPYMGDRTRGENGVWIREWEIRPGQMAYKFRTMGHPAARCLLALLPHLRNTLKEEQVRRVLNAAPKE